MLVPALWFVSSTVRVIEAWTNEVCCVWTRWCLSHASWHTWTCKLLASTSQSARRNHVFPGIITWYCLFAFLVAPLNICGTPRVLDIPITSEEKLETKSLFISGLQLLLYRMSPCMPKPPHKEIVSPWHPKCTLPIEANAVGSMYHHVLLVQKRYLRQKYPFCHICSY